MRNSEKDGAQKNPSMGKSRAKYKCPTELEKILNKVNNLSTSTALPDWKLFYEQYPKKGLDDCDIEAFEKLEKKGLKFIFEDLINQFRRSIPENLFEKLAEEHPNQFKELDQKFRKLGFELNADIFDVLISRLNRLFKRMPSIEDISSAPPSIKALRNAFETSLLLSTHANFAVEATRKAYQEKLITLDTKDEIASCLSLLANYGQYKHSLLAAASEYMQLAENLENRDNLRRIIKYRLIGQKQKTTDLRLIGVESTLIMKGTIVKVIPSQFFLAIDGVDADRIRACKICNAVFWAIRKDSESCSPHCYNTLRQRLHREKNREIINERRRANYSYKRDKVE